MPPRKNNGLITSISDIEVNDTATVRLTVPVRPDQEETLTRIVRTISQSRDKTHRKQRITKATIIRAYIDALSSMPIDLTNIPDEKEMLGRLLRLLNC
jgi:hypothetical protein